MVKMYLSIEGFVQIAKKEHICFSGDQESVTKLTQLCLCCFLVRKLLPLDGHSGLPEKDVMEQGRREVSRSRLTGTEVVLVVGF